LGAQIVQLLGGDSEQIARDDRLQIPPMFTALVGSW
jgi:hypothetical protein